ncbi:MAG: glycoside hydrolase domain-containing protein [Clostridia bacterium]
MDVMVLKTQQWLNETYNGRTGYVSVSETGNTGWNTIYALRRALQIELGITATSSNFGPSTTAKFKERFPNGVHQQAIDDETENNIYGIIQGALWCKGYSTNASYITTHFYNGTGNGIKSMKTDAGMINPDSTVTLEVMKALLSMNQFKKVYGGSDSIRTIQQRLNREYSGYINYEPCDGIYGREMAESLIIALQSIEGFSVSEATGNFGNGTKSRLPIIPYTGNTYTTEEIGKAILLIRYALYCNGYTQVNIESNQWDILLENLIEQFQNELCLPVTKKCDTNTWMSLMISKGNPDRACTACDTRFEMTNEVLEYLKNNGYQIIGRYLTGGTFKGLRQDEPKRIISKQMKLFPIFQESGAELDYFTYARGEEDARKAVAAARKYGLPGDNVIYFAVDTDPTDPEITSYIMPYFRGISENITPTYKVGIYGTRNACTRVMNAGYAETCFVSDMSTGYSGNMGFKMPGNWNFDQFHEIKNLKIGNTTIDLDKDAFSGRYQPISSLYGDILTYNNYIVQLENLYIQYKESKSETYTPRIIARGITNFLRSFKYDKGLFYVAFLQGINNEFVNYVKNNNLNLYNNLKEYAESDNIALIDKAGGLIDIGHLAATVEGYAYGTLVDSFWLGWGGDLATAMKQVDSTHANNPNESYYSIAKRLIGKRSNFGYADICTDADAIKIAELIENSDSNHAFSDAIELYYGGLGLPLRYSYYLEDFGVNESESYTTAISQKMTNGFVNSVGVQILGGIPSNEAKQACCEAFSNFIIEYYDFYRWFNSTIIA